MILRNNSKNEWLNYHNGIDIKAESTFEVSQKDGEFILNLLGHENWVVEVKADEVIEKIKEDEPKEAKNIVAPEEEVKKEEIKVEKEEKKPVVKKEESKSEKKRKEVQKETKKQLK